MRVVYDPKWLNDPKCELQYIPLNDEECAVFVYKYNGKVVQTILPAIMKMIMESRAAIKRKMKVEKDPFVKATLDCMQLTEKIRNNGAYGFLGSNTSGMQCNALAAMICMLGAWQNRTVMMYIHIPEKYWFLPKLQHCSELLKELPQYNPLFDLFPSHVASIIVTYTDTFPSDMSFMCPAQCLAVFYHHHPEAKPLRLIGRDEVGDYIYGDTDSTFVQWMLPVHLKEERDILQAIIDKTNRFQKFIMQLFPPPTLIEFEALKYPLMLGDGKKLHLSLAYAEANINKEPKVCVKGASYLKRDRCMIVRTEVHQMVEKMLYRKPNEEILQYAKQMLKRCFTNNPLTTRAEVEPFVISMKYTGDYKKDEVIGYHLANKIKAQTGVLPAVGKRMKFVIALFLDSRLHYLRAVTISEFLEKKLSIDMNWYLKTNLFQPLKQIFSVSSQHRVLLDHFEHAIHQHYEFLQVEKSGQRRLVLKRKPELK